MDVVETPVPSREPIDDEACRAFRQAAELAGRKWNAAVLLALARGAERFGELADAVDGISHRLLAARLRELEAHGLVEREVVPSVPVRVSYRLSASGTELIAILHPLVRWAQRWAP
jgi:DNA-binding HxlR family transcriptional regulator